jgi:hypothetical protein
MAARVAGDVRMRRLAPLLAIVASLLAGTASAEVVNIPASQDNTMYSEDGSRSNGAGDHFFAGRTKDGFDRRALIAFDVSGAIPAGSIVNSVTLDLYLSRARSQNDDVSLHAVLAAWGEGTSHASGEEGGGAAATPNDATWTHRLYRHGGGRPGLAGRDPLQPRVARDRE